MRKSVMIIAGILVMCMSGVGGASHGGLDQAKENPFDPVSIKERVSYRLIQEGQTYRVGNPKYEASFTEEGLSFVPLIGDGVKGREMGFSLEAIHAGDEALSFTKEGFEVKENRITYSLSRPVEEVYIAREEGIEQVFHLKAPVSSKGEDLVLTVAVQTELQPKVGRQEIGFFDEKGEKVATYGAVTVFDARGKEKTFLPKLRGGQVALVVPGEFLKDAAYPITVDPLIGSDFAICDQGDGQGRAAIAFDGTNYLVVWQDERNASRDIYGQRVSKAGGLVGTDFAICNQGDDQEFPDIGFDGTNYLVVWEDERNASRDIYGQRVNTGGGLVGGSLAICNEGHYQYVPAIAFDGTNYLVVWEDYRSGRDIYGQRVNTDGGLLGGNFGIYTGIEGQSYPAVAFDGTNYLVVWQDTRDGLGIDSDIYGRRVSSAGGLVGGDFAICNQADHQDFSAIAFDGTNYLVVWEDRRNESIDIYAQRVSPAGALLDGNFAICNQGDGQGKPAIAFDGTNYLVVWSDHRYDDDYSDIYGQRVSKEGGLVGGNFAICDLDDSQYSPDVTFDGTNYLVAWSDTRNASTDIYGQRVSGRGGFILHKSGAVWMDQGGWDTSTTPYTPGVDWAQDLERDLSSWDFLILHKTGAFWTSWAGWWTGDPYIPGTDWARDVEYDIDTGTAVILHKAGAWYSNFGWWTAEPYTPGVDWAVDLEYDPTEEAGVILHRAGAFWTTWGGWWTGDPYIPGTDWARDLEYDADTSIAVILHKAGAWFSNLGWWTGDPYTPGVDWAVDLEYDAASGKWVILHKCGARWDTVAGWDTTSPPYTPGVDWARDFEF